MKTRASEVEVNRVAIDTVGLALQKLPYNSQDEADKALAEHFLLRNLARVVNSRLGKIEDKIKDLFKAGEKENDVTLTENYRRELSRGTGRELFDIDAFIKNVVEEYPEVSGPRLKEISINSKKMSSPTTIIEIEYVGDVARANK